ncbi:MAG: hypothetical protein R6V35_01890 [Candidatus Nanohaloarchaea archaeon]
MRTYSSNLQKASGPVISHRETRVYKPFQALRNYEESTVCSDSHILHPVIGCNSGSEYFAKSCTERYFGTSAGKLGAAVDRRNQY